MREDVAELLRTELAGAYLVWMDANARAVAEDAPGVSVEIAGRAFTQKPQRYAAKAFAELRRKRALVADNEALAALMVETGCDAFLEPPSGAAFAEADEEGDD